MGAWKKFQNSVKNIDAKKNSEVIDLAIFFIDF